MADSCLGGCQYFVTFIDDFTRCTMVCLMKNKSEVFDKFKVYEASATNETGQKIGTLRTDNGGECCMLHVFQNYLKQKGIRHEMTAPYSPEQNGMAERMNRTLQESAWSMLKLAKLPHSLWAEAVLTAAYIRNRMPMTVIKKNTTPFKHWYGRKPDVSLKSEDGTNGRLEIIAPGVKDQKVLL